MHDPLMFSTFARVSTSELEQYIIDQERISELEQYIIDQERISELGQYIIDQEQLRTRTIHYRSRANLTMRCR